MNFGNRKRGESLLLRHDKGNRKVTFIFLLSVSISNSSDEGAGVLTEALPAGDEASSTGLPKSRETFWEEEEQRNE